MEKYKLLLQRKANQIHANSNCWRKLELMKRLAIVQKKAVIRKMLLMNLFTKQIILSQKTSTDGDEQNFVTCFRLYSYKRHKCTFVIAATASSLGCNLDEIVVSRSSVRRARIHHRREIINEIRGLFIHVPI